MVSGAMGSVTMATVAMASVATASGVIVSAVTASVAIVSVTMATIYHWFVTECTCNWLGADRNATAVCDRVTGQCPCLPNVIGPACDQCAADHWKLASGVGCELCQCDNEGSHSPQCNEFDGQCQCMEGRGGKRCDQCMALHYGDPTKECFRKYIPTLI